MIRLWMILTILFSVINTLSQEIPSEILEKAAENLDISAENAVLTEVYTDKQNQPIDLNNAAMQEIESLPFLSQEQSFKLQEYLLTWGEVFSIYELQAIPGFDSSLLQRIEPYLLIRPVSREPPLTPRNFSKYAMHNLMVRCSRKLILPSGYTTVSPISSKEYPGMPEALYFRFNSFYFNKLSIGIAGEKDPGEQFFRGAQSSGLDKYAGYVSLQFKGVLEKIIAGNFRAGFGQGLCLGSGTSLSMVPGTGLESTTETGIRPSLGMNESRYLAGLAASVKVKTVRFCTFFSYHPRDATLKIVDGKETFTSFSESGFHRTPAELSKRNTVSELLAGGHIQIRLTPSQSFGFQIGLTGLVSNYSIPKAASTDLYQKHTFSGSWNQVSGIDILLRFRHGNFSGEVSRSRSGGIAWVAGLTLNPDPRLQINWRSRSFGLQYQNENAAAFRQFSNANSESGNYFSMIILPGRNMSLALFLDLFSSKWSQYRNDLPGQGEEFGIRLLWQPARTVALNLSFIQKNILSNTIDTGNQSMHAIANQTVQSCLLSMEWAPSDRIRLKSRIDVKSGNGHSGLKEAGYAATQDIAIKFTRMASVLTLRYGIFDIPAYETRIYLYEPQVLYGYSVPAFQGKGNRIIAMIRLSINRLISFWLRCGMTTYFDRTSIGTGPDQINSSWSGELTGQVQVKL